MPFASWVNTLCSLATLALVAGAAGAADDLTVELARQGPGFAVRAGATLAAPVALVWEVLTDYEKLPQFIPGIATSAVRLRAGNRLLVEQKGEARFLIFAYPIEVQLEVREQPRRRVESRAVAGNLKRMSGRYELHPEGAGVRLRYTADIEPDFELPPLIGPLVLRNMVEDQFTAMVAEIERRAALAK